MITYFLTSFLLLINILPLFFKKHIKFLAFLLLGFIWILYWGNYDNPDYYNYVRIYSNSGSKGLFFSGLDLQIGFIALAKTGNYFGLNYEAFNALVTLISYALIHSTVRKYSTNYNYVYFLYFIFPFFFDVVQIKNFLAMAIFIYAIRFLVIPKASSKVKYVALIFIAATIHYSALLYLPFLLINSRKQNKLPRFIAIFAVLSSLIILLNGKQIPFINDLFIQLLESDKVKTWLDKRTNLGFLLFWFLQFSSFIFVRYSRLLYKKNITNELAFKSHKDKYYLFINLVYWINVIAFIFLPLYLVASTFTRLMRNILMLNYIVFSIVNSSVIRSKQKIMYNTFVFLYTLIFFAILLLPMFEDVVKPIMEYNLILN